jgi:urocanate hydratase
VVNTLSALSSISKDPGLGIVRHAIAGYEKARKVAKEKGIKIPYLDYKKEKI